MSDPVLHWANLMIVNVDEAANYYGSHPTFVEWAGVDGAEAYRNRSVCSTFLIALLKQSYGLSARDLQVWLGVAAPLAAAWHDAIVAQNGFQRISQVTAIDAGDIIAIKYPAGSDSTGHVAIVEAPPVLRVASAPLVPGTWQYEVVVADSTHAAHGADDTRAHSDGSSASGAGAGTMRLYASQGGTILGYTWSTSAQSVYYAQAQRGIAVGRYDPAI